MSALITQLITPYKIIFLNFYALVKNTIFFTFNGKKIYSNTNEFKDHEIVKNGDKLKELYKDLLKKTHVRKDVYIIEYPHPMCFCVGYQLSLSKDSHAGIFMSKGLFELDRDAFSFLLKHELSHIKFCDVLMSSMISILGLTFCAWLASCFFSTWNIIYISICLIPLMNHFLGGLWMHYRETRADAFAIKHSTTDEIRGAVRYFSAIKKYNASLSSNHPQYTREGELAKGFHYPKNSNRIQIFLNEVKKRTGFVYDPEMDSIDRHVALLKANDDALKNILTTPQT